MQLRTPRRPLCPSEAGGGPLMLPKHRSRIRPRNRAREWLQIPTSPRNPPAPRAAPELGKASLGSSPAGLAPTTPASGTPFPAHWGLGLSPPKFHSADFHQQKMVWGPTCRRAGIATPSSMEKTPSGTAGACRTSHRPGWVRPAPGTDPPACHNPSSAARAGFTAGPDLSPQRDRCRNAVIIKTSTQAGPQERRSSRCSYGCAHKSSPTRQPGRGDLYGEINITMFKGKKPKNASSWAPLPLGTGLPA